MATVSINLESSPEPAVKVEVPEPASRVAQVFAALLLPGQAP